MLACFFIAFYIFENRRNAAHYRSDDAGACCFCFAYIRYCRNKDRGSDRFFFAYFPSLPQQNRGLRSFLLCLLPLFATTK